MAQMKPCHAIEGQSSLHGRVSASESRTTSVHPKTPEGDSARVFLLPLVAHQTPLRVFSDVKVLWVCQTSEAALSLCSLARATGSIALANSHCVSAFVAEPVAGVTCATFGYGVYHGKDAEVDSGGGEQGSYRQFSPPWTRCVCQTLWKAVTRNW